MSYIRTCAITDTLACRADASRALTVLRSSLQLSEKHSVPSPVMFPGSRLPSREREEREAERGSNKGSEEYAVGALSRSREPLPRLVRRLAADQDRRGTDDDDCHFCPLFDGWPAPRFDAPSMAPLSQSGIPSECALVLPGRESARGCCGCHTCHSFACVQPFLRLAANPTHACFSLFKSTRRTAARNDEESACRRGTTAHGGRD